MSNQLFLRDVIRCKHNKSYIFRKLTSADRERLGLFFSSLSDNTRIRFGPHPLTHEHANVLCASLTDDSVTRFIVETEDKFVGYFILDFRVIEHEVKRYRSYGIVLNPKSDPLFAPCIADDYQNFGISSAVMSNIIAYAKGVNCASLVLLGGTQESNELGISFYKKWGFKECGRYFHKGNNIDMRLIFSK